MILWSTHTYKYSELVKDSPMITWQKKKSSLICKGVCATPTIKSTHSQGGLGKFLVACFIIRSLVISLTTGTPLLQHQSFLNQLTDGWFHHEWKIEHPLVWELREILLMPNRNWNGSMKNKRRWEFSNWGVLLHVDTLLKTHTGPTQMEQCTRVRSSERRADLHLFWCGQRLGVHSRNPHLREHLSVGVTHLSEPSQGGNKSVCMASQAGRSEQLLWALKQCTPRAG